MDIKKLKHRWAVVRMCMHALILQVARAPAPGAHTIKCKHVPRVAGAAATPAKGKTKGSTILRTDSKTSL